MRAITISTENSETYSSISNFFIDYYMTKANGEFVKIYLYLVRLLSFNKPFTVAEVADHFDLTEKDICRAIKYWVSVNVLKLSYGEDNYPTGIIMLPLECPNMKANPENDAMSLLRRDVAETDKHDSANTAAKSNVAQYSSRDSVTAEAATPPKKNMDKDAMDSMIRNPEWQDLSYQVTTIMNKSELSHSETEILMYIYQDLGFNEDLIIYLLEYMGKLGKSSFNYMEAVAREWYAMGIKTAKQAKEQCLILNEITKIVLSSLGYDRKATQTDMKYISKWVSEYKYSDDMIKKACDKAVSSSRSATLQYVNGIIEAWHKKGIKTLKDVERNDAEFAEAKKAGAVQTVSKPRRSSKVSVFNSFEQTDTDEQISHMEELLLKEINEQ